MRRFIILALVALPAMSCARTADRLPTVESIDDLEARWAAAIRDRDSLVLDGLVAPTFQLAATGATDRPPVMRSEWMDNALHHLRVDSVRTWPARLAVHGDTTDATLSFYWRGRFDTEPEFRDSVVLTDRWIRGNGTWRVYRRTLSQ